MNTTFTPGPWTFSRWNEFGDMRFYIAQADGAPHTPQLSDVATLIAETTSNEWQSIQEANAKLIAAAPELLAALQAALPFIDDAGDIAQFYPDSSATDKCRVAVKQAHAAIAKATGGTQ